MIGKKNSMKCDYCEAEGIAGIDSEYLELLHMKPNPNTPKSHYISEKKYFCNDECHTKWTIENFRFEKKFGGNS